MLQLSIYFKPVMKLIKPSLYFLGDQYGFEGWSF